MSVKFTTKDLNQAAFIWSQEGAKLASVNPTGNGRSFTVFFIFELPLSEEELSDLHINYANGDTSVEPKKFCEKQTSLRDYLHNSLGIERKKNNKE